MYGPEILTRTLSIPSKGTSAKPYQFGRSWQYHSRSDRHSKVASWGLVFDLLLACPLLRNHAHDEKVSVGINHELRDFRNKKSKNLDLVIARSDGAATGGGSKGGFRNAKSFAELADVYQIELTAREREALAGLPRLSLAGVSNVLVAVEAKAAMTAFSKARPRLKDELTGSHSTVHGDTDHAIAAGIVVVNAASCFVSPDKNKFEKSAMPDVVNLHRQPKDAELVIEGLRELQRRSRVGDSGFDALGVVVLDCANDGRAVTLVTTHPPAPDPTDDFDYSRFVARIAQLYTSRFNQL